MLNLSKKQLITILIISLLATITMLLALNVLSLKTQALQDFKVLKDNQAITTGINSKYTQEYTRTNEQLDKEINNSYLPWALQNTVNKIYTTNLATIETYTAEIANVKSEFLQSLVAWKDGISQDKDFEGKTEALKDIQNLDEKVNTIVTAQDLEVQKNSFKNLQLTYQSQLDLYNKKAFLDGVKSAENDINDLINYLKKYPELSTALSNVDKYKTEISNISNEESLKKISYQDLENKVNNEIRPMLASAFSAKSENEELIRLKSKPTNPNSSSNLPITTGKLILIKKGEQKMYVYNDGILLRQTPVTTGRTNWPTDVGTYSILTKERNRRLQGSGQGATWNVFVKYWMLFNASEEEGIHDASWRNGNFGGPDFVTNGSRGCVNTPDETMIWLFDWAKIGTPVVVQD